VATTDAPTAAAMDVDAGAREGAADIKDSTATAAGPPAVKRVKRAHDEAPPAHTAQSVSEWPACEPSHTSPSTAHL
jgi:hypothetical protein